MRQFIAALFTVVLFAHPVLAHQPAWPDSSGSGGGIFGGIVGGVPTAAFSAEWFAQNVATADFTTPEVMNRTSSGASVAFGVTNRHTTAATATRAAGQVATPSSFTCSLANDTGTGTARFTLNVVEDEADATLEPIATLDFALASEITFIKTTTTFTAITSTAPYYFVVLMSDGGSVAFTGAAADVQCQATWTRP